MTHQHAAHAVESVRDYPRPPRIEEDSRRIVVRSGESVLADTTRSIRVLETSHPPVFYLPPPEVELNLLRSNPHTTFCEFKGRAVYWDVIVGQTISRAAWSYPVPSPGFEELKDWIAFYPSKVDCTVDGEAVKAQAGGFYGGWITSEIAGPFKGEPGTNSW
ncbi:MAG: DUF427 domain-containing protein [Acidimicrobiia bacterium]